MAEEGVQRIAEITHRDKELLKIPEENRKEEDIQALREATESFFAWAQQHLNEVPGGSNIGKAFKYALNRKKSLEVIPQHLEDTNLVFLDDLLPWSEEVQKRCRSNLEKEKTEN
ncbi:IS66 family transposase [Eubacterium sp. F2]|uniref:IS66 family transposase n=1 Tax=Eubacterium sp. F2 TaxID=3381348 RepID=UPI003907F666